ncbi:hypothetical protein PTKIN_Ptkin12aG0086200 [Pterospermum kingtungense]
MAHNPSLLSLSLSLVLLFHGCLTRSESQSQQFQNECQINSLDTIKPATRVRSEAGETEWWNPNSQQLKCAGVSVLRYTVQPDGLVLPSFSNAPQLVYVVQGRGIQGTVMPGCPETFQDSQQSQQGQSHRFQDKHQKVRSLREGDVFAIPAGVVHWCYNDGDQPLITVNLLDTSNSANQLDNNPRKFHLAGNPGEEQRQLRKLQQQQQQGSRSEREHEEGDDEDEDNLIIWSRRSPLHSCSNLLCGMDPQLLAQALNVDINLIKKLRDVKGNMGTIVRVKDGLQVVRPPRMEHEEREERERESQHGSRGRSDDNGLEETFCSMRIKENIADPERADIFNPQAGRITTLNSFNLPILKFLRLSAERGVLYNKAGLIPQWSMNAHRIFYMLRGRARLQVVNQNGDTVFDGYLERGQLLTVPQNFAFVKRAGSEGAEWICFFTNDNATNTPLAGRVSALRAIPDEVLAASYDISREEARRVKYGNQDTFFFTSSSSERREDA